MPEVEVASLLDFATYYDASLMNPKVLVGMFIGAMSVFLFCALTMKAVGRAAKGMVEEVRRQFREKPGIMAGTDTPDYAAPVRISTQDPAGIRPCLASHASIASGVRRKSSSSAASREQSMTQAGATSRCGAIVSVAPSA